MHFYGGTKFGKGDQIWQGGPILAAKIGPRENFIIVCTCTKSRCGMHESSASFSNTNIILFGALCAKP